MRILTLSIGMPIYNGATFVQEAIDSILEQDCDLELVISDNGSKDDTQKICLDYAARDCRVKYYRYEENRGAAWNYNNCFNLSKGKYFKWAAYDDRLAPDFAVKCLKILESDPHVVLAYPTAVIIDDMGRFVRYDSDRLNLLDDRPSIRFGEFFKAYEGDNICNPVFGIFRREVLARTRLIGNYLTSDRILLGEICLNGKIAEIPDGLFYYRWHPSNSTNGYSHAERLLWFDPANQGKLFMQYWVWLTNWSDSITKAPMATFEKLRCRARLASWAFEHAGGLSKELVKAILWPILRRTAYRHRDMGL